MDAVLLRLDLANESDVFLVRQRGREVAAAVGLAAQDQIRVATALSDLSRDLVNPPTASAAVVFRLADRPPSLLIEIGPVADHTTIEQGVGWQTSARLMDQVRHDEHGLRLVKYLPTGAALPGQDELAGLRIRLGRLGRVSVLDELRAQNQELLRTLENLERNQAELTRMNAELEETNKGVLALYKQLSDELDQTNQGVVALYAELDDKSTQLTEANQAKTRFWSNISHELRTPINSVIGLAQLLAAPGSDELTAEQRRQVDLIHDAGRTLLALVNELLDAAKAESGQLVARLAPVRVDALFAQLRGLLRPLVASDDVELRIEDPDPLPTVLTDEVLLVRILRNLLSNGLKFTRAGEVRLTAQAVGEWLVFEVSDTGIGIPADQQAKVFEEFYQVRNELQVGHSGTGLGLPYSRRLTEILGGDLTLHSEFGVGTRLTLRIPLTDAHADALPQLDTVLVVDDAADYRRRIATLAADLAAQVIEASDGRSALAAVATHRPALILLDLRMPDMDGHEVLAELRRVPATSTVPVVIVTSADPSSLQPVDDPTVAVLSKTDLSAESLRHAVRQILPGTEGTSR